MSFQAAFCWAATKKCSFRLKITAVSQPSFSGMVRWGNFPPKFCFFWIHPSRWSDDGIYSCSYWQEIRKSQGPKIMCFFSTNEAGKAKNVTFMSVCEWSWWPLEHLQSIKTCALCRFSLEQTCCLLKKSNTLDIPWQWLIVNQKKSVSPFHLEFSFQPICKFACFFI